jgi:hypothetical protein
MNATMWTGHGIAPVRKTFDPNYGIKLRGNSTKLGLPVDGKYLYGQDAFNEADKPIWGGEKLYDLFPFQKEVPSAIIQVTNWKKLSEETPPADDTTTEYETYRVLDENHSVQFEDSHYIPEMWAFAGVEYWKPVDMADTHDEINPAYQPYQDAVTEFKRLLQLYFVELGDYLFPILPLGYDWYYRENAAITAPADKIPNDPNHFLASETRSPGTKVIYKPKPVNVNSAFWNGRISIGILSGYYDHAQGFNYMLGI